MLIKMETREIVENILSANKNVDINPVKAIDVEFDLGNLLASDPNQLDAKELRLRGDDYLKDLARENTQLLFNKIWELDVERVEDVIVAKLPAPTTVLPREKKIPAERKATKWQSYAQVKGIQKKKKGRMAWDDQLKTWKPKWGYQRANDDTKDWLIEVPQQADPNEDQFAKRIKAKKEIIAKNELQRVRNIARNMKGKVPGVGLTPLEKPDKDHLSRALTLAKKSTASLGKFTESLPKEKTAKNMGKKRKFESNTGELKNEKKRALDIFDKIQNHQPLLDVEKAANRQKAERETSRAASRSRTGDSDDGGRKKKPKSEPKRTRGKAAGRSRGKQGGGKQGGGGKKRKH